MKQLGGIIIPTVTPFDKSGELRLDWLEKNYLRWNQTKVSGCMALGSNGEFRSLSDDESFAVLEVASRTISKDKILVAGIGRESLFQTLAFLKRLEQAQLAIDYVAVLTPCYFKSLMTDEALITYYKAVADASSYPVLIYCAPGFANDVCISVEALKELANHSNIVGIKDTSKNMMNAYMDAVGSREDFQVLAGSLGSLMVCLERGGTGGVLSAANYFPNLCAKLCQVVKKDGLVQARTYHAQLKMLVEMTGGRNGVAGVKATMNLMGYYGGFPRQPIQPCTDCLLAEVKSCLEKYSMLILEDMP